MIRLELEQAFLVFGERLGSMLGDIVNAVFDKLSI